MPVYRRIVPVAALAAAGFGAAAPAHAQFGFDFSIGRDTFNSIAAGSLTFTFGGDTFGDPFILRNTSTSDVGIVGLELDLGPAGGFVFDTFGADSKAFQTDTSVAGSSAAGVGLVTPVSVVDGGSSLSLDFTAFDPGELYAFIVDVDTDAAPTAGEESVTGADLVGGVVSVSFDNGETLVAALTGFDGLLGEQASQAAASAGGDAEATAVPSPSAAIAGAALLLGFALRRRRVV